MTDSPIGERPSPLADLGRLATIRRLYFYLVGFISLMAGLAAVRGLLAVLVELWLAESPVMDANAAGFVRNAIARQGGLLVVSAPIFLIHWLYIRGLAARPGEATAALRKLFFYAALAVTLVVSAVSLHQLISGGTALLLGQSLNRSELWPSGWLVQLLHLGVHGPLFLYFLGQLRADGDWGAEAGWAGLWRRLFQALVGLAGLSLLLTGAASGLEFVWRSLLESLTGAEVATAGAGWWRSGIANAVANLLLGGLLWRLNARAWDGLMAAHPPEGRTALRRLYLYAATILSAIAALVPAALLLRLGILLLLGTGESVDVAEAATALGFLPVGVLAWRWHWAQVSAEAARYGDSDESALVRRLYYYSVAATGLILLWVGLVDLLRALLDWAVVGTASTEQGFRAEQIATGLSLIAVGAPVWAVHWRTAQRAAGLEGAAGRAERGSWPRRLYLYGIALAGALLILFELAQVLYRIFLWALGDPSADAFGIETLDSLVRSGTAAVFWAVHVLAIRTDTRLADDEAEAEAALAPIPAADAPATRRAELMAQIVLLENELARLQAELSALDEQPDLSSDNPNGQ